MRTLFLMACFFMVLFPDQLLAVEEEKEVRYPRVSAEEYEVEAAKVRPFNILIGIIRGYDNNVNLDASRKGDLFSQQNLDLEFSRPLSDRLRYRFNYSLTNIFYHEFTDENIFDNILGLHLAHRITDGLLMEVGYEFDIMRYPKNDQGDYMGHKGMVSLRHRFTDRLYQAVSYEYLDRGYDERKAKDGAGNATDDERCDRRHTIEHEMGYYLTNSLIRLRNRYYYNDSNDLYLDYYDYGSYRITLSCSRIFADRLLALVGIGEELRDFDHRTISTDGKAEEDELFMAYAGLIYEISPSLSMGLSYIYRENDSNDPVQEYSGSIIAMEFSYSF